MNANWQVHVLGGLSVHGPGISTTHFRSQRGAALLGCLAFHLGRAMPRESLAELLWPEAEPDVGRANMRVELTGLRRIFAAPDAGAADVVALRSDRRTVCLDPRVVDTDAAAFERALAHARATEGTEREPDALREAVERYGGALLPGLYDDWIGPERDRLAAQFVGAAERLVILLEVSGDLDGAIEMAHRALAADPLREEAHARLIRLYAAAGRPDAAGSRARALRKMLREELDCEPSAETRALLSSLGLDAARTVAPLAAPPRPRLPAARTRFFGREEELARLRTWLRPGALVTLTGIGGVGKTRLALEAAARLAPTYGGAVWFAPLADVRQADSISLAVASALALPHDPATPPLPQVAAALAERPALLVLDNLEHLLDDRANDDAVAAVQELMDAAPSLAVLATSRRRIGLEGEQEFPVPPLALVPPSLEGSDAVRLFTDRARQVRPAFSLSDDTARVVAEICDCVDGIPLAIELAAAWVQTLTPRQIRGRLRAESGRLDLLVSRERTRPARHRSVSAALRWGYDLLPPYLQEALTHLSALAGSFDLETAGIALCVPDALDDLTALRERSLIVVEEHSAGMRYRLLETVRDFALGLLPAEARAEVEARLARFYLARVERLDRELRGPGSAAAMAQLAADEASIEQALATLVGSEGGIRIAAALAGWWAASGRLQEGRKWLLRALDECPGATSAVRAAALFAATALAAFHGALEEAGRLAACGADLVMPLDDTQACWALRPLANPHLLLNFASGFAATVQRLMPRASELPDISVQAFLYAAMGQIVQYRGEYEHAVRLLEQAIALYREIGDYVGVAAALCQRSNMAMLRGEYAEAERSWEEALTHYRRLEDEVGMADVLGSLGYVARLTGRYEHARSLLKESMAVSRRLGLRGKDISALWGLGAIALRTGDYEEARSALDESLRVHREIGGRSCVADCHAAQGALAMCLGDFEAARRYHREALALREEANDRLDVAHSRSALADVALLCGEVDEAARGYAAALALAQEMQSQFAIANARIGLGLCAARFGDLTDAAEHVTAGLDLLRAVPDPQYRALGMEALAEVRCLQDRAAEAARALGAAEALRAESGTPLPRSYRARMATLTGAIRAALGNAAFESSIAGGRALPPDEAIQRLLTP